jgi:uncharacterized membrane protein
MLILALTTLTSMGLLAGCELAISLFVNPAIWKLNGPQYVELWGRWLGKAMPPWYAANLLLLIAEAFLHRHTGEESLILAATAIQVAMILFSVIVLVPINNRLVASQKDWISSHKKWDKLHRWRIAFLVLAFVLAAAGLGAH